MFIDNIRESLDKFALKQYNIHNRNFANISKWGNDMNESQIRSDSGDLLFRLYYSTAAPSKRPYREHHHTELEISLVTAGRGIYTVKNRQYDIAPGDIFLFGTHEEHYITDISEGITLMNLHFEPRFIWASQGEMFDAKYLKIFFDRSESFENCLDRQNPATEKIRRLLLEIESELSSRGPEFELMAKVKLLTILVLLIREYDYVSTDRSYTESAKFHGVSTAMKYLDENLEKTLTLDELAAKAGINKTYFISLFRRLNGVTPWEYITARRIERASKLLLTGEENVMSEAKKCGFNSASNFNRAFRKATGLTPSEWKKRRQSEAL